VRKPDDHHAVVPRQLTTVTARLAGTGCRGKRARRDRPFFPLPHLGPRLRRGRP
jgi:hypothetical protein